MFQRYFFQSAQVFLPTLPYYETEQNVLRDMFQNISEQCKQWEEITNRCKCKVYVFESWTAKSESLPAHR